MQDLRLAFRNLVRRPGFSVIAVLTMALGIGANAAVFTVSRAVLLAPLPYADPSRVVILNESTPQFPIGSVTRYNYDDWRTRATSFTGMGAFRPTTMTVMGGGDPERVPVKMITASLLPLLGVTPMHGRNISEAEDERGAPGVAVLSAGFAMRYFTGEDPLGRSLQLDNRPYTVVGVLVERVLGPLRLFVNGENLTNVRQTPFDSLLRPSAAPDGRWTVDAWSPLDGRNINGGVRLRF